MTSLPSRAYAHVLVSIDFSCQMPKQSCDSNICRGGASSYVGRWVWSSYLGEQRGPDGLDLVTGSLDDGLKLVGLLWCSLSAKFADITVVYDKIAKMVVGRIGGWAFLVR